MKSIVLAGGAGTRLWPLSLVTSKQLQPVYDKPMIYYPLTTLIESGIRDILLISTPVDTPSFQKLLGDGSRFGIRLSYCVQQKPEGLAQAFTLGDRFIGQDNVCLILGDNLFSGFTEIPSACQRFTSGGTVFGYEVSNPQRYAVVNFDPAGKPLEIIEKPTHPKSNYAVPGIYFFDSDVVPIARAQVPSARGELEITGVMNEYLRRGTLQVLKVGRGAAWLDSGTTSSLQEASAYVQTIEQRQGIKIGCPEEAALKQGFLTPIQLKRQFDDGTIPSCEYRSYLERLVA
ncbi:glucose-1-phosphate thymidylyltransferase [Candidatus Pacearchaeota archaeon]|nr:glucose-1-phosphate thymidylyltransferase [Candidatus Pacearchaeota archaeon]